MKKRADVIMAIAGALVLTKEAYKISSQESSGNDGIAANLLLLSFQDKELLATLLEEGNKLAEDLLENT